MKLADINARLTEFHSKFGYDARAAMQGSEAWMNLKLGVLSASNAHKIVAKVDSETRATYMAELVAQVATGIFEEINAKALDWGNQNEDAARSSYEFSTGNQITQVPFVFRDSTFRAGYSPDGLVGEDKDVEIKCPFNSANYVKFLCESKLKPEWVWQNEFAMWVSGAKSRDLVQYDPRMKSTPLHVVTVESDEKKQKTIEDAVPQFIEAMDKMLAKAGVEWGEQWRRLVVKEKVG